MQRTLTSHRFGPTLGLLLAGLLLLVGFPAFAQKTVTITCRCVEGGTNSTQVEWLRGWVMPNFETMMAEQDNPVAVELIEFGGTDEALKEQYALDLSVGRGADVLGFDGFWVPEFVGAGTLLPLNEVAGAEVDSWEGWSHIPEGLQSLLGYDGELYGIALGTDSRMIFYRKDMFAEAGIAGEEEAWRPESWDEVLAAARTIKEAFPESVPLQLNAGSAMGEATTMQGYWMALMGTGEEMTDADGRWVVRSQGILETLELYSQIYLDEALGDVRVQLLQDGRNRSFENFRDGVTAMLVESDFFYRSVVAPGADFALDDRDAQLGWAPMPAREPGAGIRGQDVVNISGGTGFVLNPNAANPQEAWALLAFMNSREALMAAQEIEPRVRVRDDVPVPGDVFLTTTADTLLPLTTSRPNSEFYASVSIEAQLMTERVISGEMSPEEAMDAYASAVVDLVGEENTVDLTQ